MRYAYVQNDVAIIGAADSLVEFDAFQAELSNANVAYKEPSFKDMLTDPLYSSLTRPPLLVIHATAEDRAEFFSKYDISEVKKNALINKHGDMLAEVQENPYAADSSTGGKSIFDLHNLGTNDRWDKRTEAEKEADAEMKKRYDEAAKKGELSGGDSFKGATAGNSNPAAPKKGGAQITDIRTTVNADGSVTIDNILGVKGLYDKEVLSRSDAIAKLSAVEGETRDLTALSNDELGEALKTAELVKENDFEGVFADEDPRFVPEPVDPDSEEYEIDAAGMIAIYHKVDVIGDKLDKVRTVLLIGDITLDDEATVARNCPHGSWFATPRQLRAEEMAKVLTDAGLMVKVYAVNDKGERLAPEGVQVITEEAEADGPRPWNSRSKELTKMSKEELEEVLKSYDPAEFIYTGKYRGAQDGTIVYIAPRSYFEKNDELYPFPLGINHILPADLKEVEPGVYVSMSRNFTNIQFELAQKGMKESMYLRLLINNSR
jgi:hypothetical protein